MNTEIKTTAARYGAYPEDWDFLSQRCKLTEDLLPVVSRQNASISNVSKLKTLGKVPSRYNHKLEVVGFPRWTEAKSTAADIYQWKQVQDYGICIQTRNIRAIDVDIEDKVAAERVAKILEGFGRVRYRKDSHKFLVAFRAEGVLSKRIMKTKHGIIEFLANGQQFVAYGTHPKGARYEWKDNEDFELRSEEAIEDKWAELELELAIEPTITGRQRVKGAHLPGVKDPTLGKLNILGWGRDGQAYIECPFSGEHTTDSGDAATCYFPAGSNGYQKGHFKCLHAHCAGRSDTDFLEKLGLTEDYFTDVREIAVVGANAAAITTPTKAPERTHRWIEGDIPALIRNRMGRPETTLENVCKLLSLPEMCGYHIVKDTFKEEIIMRELHGKKWRPLSDTDYTALRHGLEIDFRFARSISREMMRDAVHFTAHNNNFDSAMRWAETLEPWDGVPRVRDFFSTYMGTKDTAYLRSVAIYAWSAMAGRLLTPGCKADMVPILIGAQGAQKSTGIEAMAPFREWFVEVSMGENEDNRIRRTKGRIVGEFGEMRGLYSAALENTKAYITRTHDTWVPKYMEQPITYGRRIFFWGTSNHIELFTDPTGNRRWLPVEVKNIRRQSIELDCKQLWAEAMVIYKTHGVLWKEAESRAFDIHGKYMITDPWSGTIETWLYSKDTDGTTPIQRGGFTTGDILTCALGLARHQQNTGIAKRIDELMHHLGFIKTQRPGGGRTLCWSYVPEDKKRQYFTLEGISERIGKPKNLIESEADVSQGASGSDTTDGVDGIDLI